MTPDAPLSARDRSAGHVARRLRLFSLVLAAFLPFILAAPSAGTSAYGLDAKKSSSAAASGGVRECYTSLDFPTIDTNVTCKLARKVATTALNRWWADEIKVSRVRGFRCVVKKTDLMTCKDGKRFIRYDARE
jgi:hypothetical protein